MSLFDPGEKKQFTAVIISHIFMGLFQAMGIVSILPFMTIVMNYKLLEEENLYSKIFHALGFNSIMVFVVTFGIVVLLIIIGGNACSAYATWLKIRFVWRNNHKISTELLKKYLSLPYVFFLNNHSSDLSKNVLAEVKQYTSGFLMPIVVFVTKGLTILFILISIIIVNPVVSFFAMLILGGSYYLIYIKLRRRLLTGGKARMEANKGRYKAAGEAFGGIKDIKITGREPYFVDRYIKHSQKISDLYAWESVVSSMPRYAMEVVAFGGVITLVIVIFFVEGNIRMAVPMLAFFATAGYRLLPYLQEIFKSLTKLQFNMAILNKLHKDMTEGSIADFAYAETAKEPLPEPLPFRKEINLKNITYFYPNTDEPVLKDINLKIKRHTSIAVAGPTGSGKTTLVDIILGLLTPQQGEISVDGTIITEDNLKNWQRNIGYVPQHIFLSDDTIARNIAFGLPDKEINREALEKAAKLANMYDYITEELPRGFETIIGERGVRLSGGQRQRVGIARALYYDPEILVLDEATSALDGITEDAVLEAIDNASKLKTMIIIAHRLTTVINCDVIYIMNKGRIEAQGGYDELMDTNIQFRAMAKAVEK